jgi:hypothetical protein
MMTSHPAPEPAAVDPAAVERFLEDAFAENYQLLKVESGRGLSPEGRRFAWNQVRLYWLKLAGIAQTVTDTEVRLTLPNQRTPRGRPYAIDGIVDIVRGEGYTVMYDIKSYEADSIRRDEALYRLCKEQLDVYAHIWQTLRREVLRETAIIATRFPKKVADALADPDPGRLAWALAQWAPIVDMEFDPSHVHDTIAEFGRVVDRIEDEPFAPRSLEDLERREGGTRQRFANSVCRNCDARFSCASYRQWALRDSSHIDEGTRRYFEDIAPDDEIDDLRTANLEATPEARELTEDFLT